MQVREVPPSFNYVSLRTNTSENALEGRRTSQTKQLRHRSEEDAFCCKVVPEKSCLKVVNEEVQKLVDQGFVKKVPPEQINHDEPEWYLPLHAVFTPERTTRVRLVFDSSSKGHDGLSRNDRLEKGPNFINSLLDVLAAWRWDVYKKDEKDHVENYRPIPLLCIISKVLERCVLNRINDRLEDLIADCQHGFRSGRSCVTNLMETLDYIGAILDRAGSRLFVFRHFQSI